MGCGIIKAVILCGGEGTRLRPLTNDIPKALVDVNGKCLVELVLDRLHFADKIILSVGYFRSKIKEYFGDKVSYIEESTPLGTGGCLKFLSNMDDDFVVVNGDNIFDINFESMVQFHKLNKGLATIGLTKVEDVSNYGSVNLNGDKIVSFSEKGSNGSGWISSGYYVLSPMVINYLPKGDFIMLETDIWPKLAATERLYGFKSDAYWADVGTLEALDKVRRDLK